MDLIHRIFSTDEFMPHGMCYEWNPAVIWLHVVSDALIALAYYSIPLTLIYFVRKRQDLVFDWMFVCFAVFIVACGTTHVMEILNVWHPTYWLSGLIKAITALTSVVTAILLIRLVPRAVALPSPRQLRQSNEALQAEIAERTRVSEKMEQLNEELLRQTARMERANKELEAFSYSVSHDLRAPLRHIDGYVQMLREDVPTLGETGTRYADKITTAAEKMGQLIDNLLAFSRLGRSALREEWVDVAELVPQLRDELAPDMHGRDIAWKIGPLPSIHVDCGLFRQVWLNLLGNAIKYTRRQPRPEITVTCTTLDDEFIFSVRDNGAGFDMRYSDKLFGLFQRLHAKEEFEGSGVGLANVKRIVERHGGRIWAEGAVDAGACFHFTVPVRPLKKGTQPLPSAAAAAKS